ncbi:hypothetical protein LGH83_08925 [Lichenihabitans sp. PAMC28606]|uniref:hypothetical protein n=1 Tax=Lichenihabitans sp. PAMC28606 TaxID=2880932 RepID=UPI001D09B9B3|nr:hypothetical protein [Lichenihabitans sp. PAMC28606]UDL96279.1 hypothetical protein LGH83_08925 [Lichenihabitans sp. PAMC28606]
MKEGYEAYLLSFMFHALHGSHGEVHGSMEKAVEQAYAKAVTRVFRYPNSQVNTRDRMKWLVFPDRPVPKHARKAVWEVRLNDGVHMHAIALVPPFTRLKVPFDVHVNANRTLYACHPLMRLHAVSITDRPEYVTGYAMKSLKRRTVDFDDVIILPRTVSQMPTRELV